MQQIIFIAALLAVFGARGDDLQTAYTHVWEQHSQLSIPCTPPSPEWFDERLANASGQAFDAALINSLRAATNVWINDPGTEEYLVCADIISRVWDRPADVSPHTASLYYAAAKAAEVIGQNQEAVNILQGAISSVGEQPAPGYERVPVKVSANIWAGRLYRDMGMADEAVAAYTRASDAVSADDPGIQDIRAWCQLYAGETLAAKGDKDAALQSLSQVEQLSQNFTESQLPLLQNQLAERLIEQLTTGSSGIVLASQTYISPEEMVKLQGALSGISLKPSSGIFFETDQNGLLQYALENAAGRASGGIDKEIAQLRLAELHTLAKRLPEAEAALREVLEGGGFLAPFAGTKLAENLIQQNRAREAAAVLKSIIEKWPAYAAAVSGASETQVNTPDGAAFQEVIAAAKNVRGVQQKNAQTAASPVGAAAQAASAQAAVVPVKPSESASGIETEGLESGGCVSAIVTGAVAGTLFAGICLLIRRRFAH
jgi:tetratricopeptide (TPR) repeat protein